MMDDRRHETFGQVPAPLLGLGVLLIASGGFIAFYVAREVLTLYQRTGNTFINTLVAQFKDADLLTFANHPLSITSEGATILAFVLFVLLALLGIHIALGLIRAGARILSPAFPHELARLKLHFQRLSDKISSK